MEAAPLPHELFGEVFPRGATPAQLSTRFSKAPKATLTQLLETLAALGQAQQSGDLYTAS